MSPEWEALRRELEALAGAALAFNAYVVDAWGLAWCSARYFEYLYADDLAKLVHVAEARVGAPVTRGGKLDIALSGPEGKAYLRTFASCYVAMLRFTAPFDEARARDAVTAALPRIESLTLRLPPPEGPGSSGNEAVGTA